MGVARHGVDAAWLQAATATAAVVLAGLAKPLRGWSTVLADKRITDQACRYELKWGVDMEG